MDEARPPRRRRGRRGRRTDGRDDAGTRPANQPPGPPGPPGSGPPPPTDATAGGPAPRQRLDTRRNRRGGEPPQTPAGGMPGRIHRRPTEERPPRESRNGRDGRPERDARGRGDRDRGPQRDVRGRGDRDGRTRSFEAPVPQDERSVELGAKFREAQNAMRDARKTLDKRKTEQGDEPDWLVAELTAAEERFAEAATEWSEHLSTTGRRVVRR